MSDNKRIFSSCFLPSLTSAIRTKRTSRRMNGSQFNFCNPPSDFSSVQAATASEFESAKESSQLTPHTQFGTSSASTVCTLQDGQTALMLAAESGHTDTMQALAALGADIHIQDRGGWTALMMAALRGHTDTMQALAALGADIHIQDKVGRTALMWAANNGHTDTMQALAALGADIHIQDKDGWTALMCAAMCGHQDTVRALEALGADIHTQDKDGNTALTHALLRKKVHSETAEALIAAGSKLNHQQKITGWTALFFAAKRGSLPLTKLMLERGADPSIRDKEGSTAYDVASVYGHEDVMKELAQHTPAAAEPPPPEHTPTTSSTATQPTSTAALSSSTKKERVLRAVRILAERIEETALPGRAEKRREGGPLTGPELILPSQRQRSNTPGGGR